MLKQIIPIVALALLMSSCNTFKPMAGALNRQYTHASAAKQPARFLNDINIPPQRTPADNRVEKASGPSRSVQQTSLQSIQYGSPVSITEPVVKGTTVPLIETAVSLQFKFALLLNTEVENVQNLALYNSLNYWLGTRYCMGGTSKRCIDCSAFTMSVYSAAYNTAIARTAREQYRTTQRISRTELKEGDLVFFNTRGGISHVGVYLQNNKFIHATTSKGVMVSDLYDDYWVRRFVGCGRVTRNEETPEGENLNNFSSSSN